MTAKWELRIPTGLMRGIRADIVRPHPFAFERVGFLFTRASSSGRIALAVRYVSLEDNEYVLDGTVGARIGTGAIRRMLSETLRAREGAFHVHLHDHLGVPGFGEVDREQLAALIPPFCTLAKDQLHGALLLSRNRAVAQLWSFGEAPTPATVTVVGNQVDRFEHNGWGFGGQA